MRLVTLLRLSIAGPVILPALMILLPVEWMAGFGTIMTVGVMYYGAGYAVFAVGFLYWLRLPRTSAELDRATLIAPILGGFSCALSVIAVEASNLGQWPAHPLDDLLLFTGFAFVIGMPYAAGVRFLSEFTTPREEGPRARIVET